MGSRSPERGTFYDLIPRELRGRPAAAARPESGVPAVAWLVLDVWKWIYAATAHGLTLKVRVAERNLIVRGVDYPHDKLVADHSPRRDLIRRIVTRMGAPKEADSQCADGD